MTSLLDTGLQALVAPREDGGGGGVGLVLGALAAVAGLAVLKQSTLEAFQQAPVLALTRNDWLETRDVALGFENVCPRRRYADAFYDLTAIGIAQGICSPDDDAVIGSYDNWKKWREEQLDVIADDMLERGDPRGYVLRFGEEVPYWVGQEVVSRYGDSFSPQAICVNATPDMVEAIASANTPEMARIIPMLPKHRAVVTQRMTPHFSPVPHRSEAMVLSLVPPWDDTQDDGA